ncbi:MAG: cation-translocating P-type ATPase [Gemmataceae bacterium]|nr:cation-translocating P-type ATPase [Gemmataceae bacterium]
MRTLTELAPDAERGLSPEAVLASRQRHGTNALTPLPREPLWKKFLEKFDEPIIKILLAAALLSMFVEIFRGHPEGAHKTEGSPALAGTLLGLLVAGVAALLVTRQGQWVPSLMFGMALVVFFAGGLGAGLWSIEGLAVMVAVILATGVAFLSEYKSDQEFEALNAHKDSIRVKVTRAGAFATVPMEEVVVGDLVDLETGDEVPADGRLLKASELLIDQSLMTGESEAVKKAAQPLAETKEGPDQPGCLYRGTQVVDGAGVLVVTEVGDATMLGQIAKKLSGDDGGDEEEGKPRTEEDRVKDKLTISKTLTPLQLKLKDLADLISNVGYAAAALIFVALLVRGFFTGELDPEKLGWIGVFGNLLNYFVYMVIIIVVAVPEGLPMSVTVSLALAMQKMTRANSLVRQLVACETIGSATVICSDKTGTLTQNKMQVVRFFSGGAGTDRDGPGWMPPGGMVALNAAANSTANLEEKEGKVVSVGSSTEAALLHWLREGGADHIRLRAENPVLHLFHFKSEVKRMTTVVRHGGKLVALTKGAPEIVLALCTHWRDGDAVKPLDAAARDAINAWIQDSARQAMRTLAFAHKELPAGYPESEEALADRREEIEAGLVFDGLVAIRDPLRVDVKDAVARCRAAGIEVKMITGDNVETARAIAHGIGLVDSLDAPIDTEDARVLTSPRFNAEYDQWKAAPADSPERARIGEGLAGLRVLARARPLDKVKIVELLQSRQEVVAMTGDGTNDAASLKRADVGLSMGIAGTEVAKEASKIVLLDDSFGTIVSAVKWGRSLYENIQRFIQFQLTINVSALTIAFLGPFFGVKPPFTVLQLLWINVIMDTFASIALCSEPPREGVMALPPKKRDESIITPQMVQTILGTAAFFIVVMMALLLGMQHGGWFAHPPDGTSRLSEDFAPLTVRQVSIFFAVYVFFQVWNQINSRSLVPEESGFARLFGNPTFLLIAGLIAVGQIALTSVPWLAGVFKVEPLGPVDWLVIVASTASVLVFAEVWRRVRLAARPRLGP